MKINKDGSIRKKPGRKPKATVEHLTVFPSLTLRQTAIVLAAVENSMADYPDFTVDGEPVQMVEWVETLRALSRGFRD
jgi:hypothetical protein